MALAVLFLIAGVYAIYIGALIYSTTTSLDAELVFFQPQALAWISLGVLVLVTGGSLYKIHQLSGGGKAVAQMLGGTLVAPDTAEPYHRRLLNVVEEMAIASGSPVPDVYVLETEGGINAFAAGYGTEDAVICVTKGALELLTRDELQGVVAHEFSHILNSDTLINIRLMGVLHGILIISLIGKAILRGLGSGRRSRSNKGAAAGAMLGIALYIVGYMGWFMGNVIKSAVSRQREHLADASAVQFTRNPSGLAGALKKIGGLTTGSQLAHPRANEASHMYFSDGIGDRLLSFLDTHPPLIERVRALEPRFDGTFPEMQPVKVDLPKELVVPKYEAPARATPVAMMQGAAVLAMLNTASNPMQEHIGAARGIIDTIPQGLKDAARDTKISRALIYALLMDAKPEIAGAQMAAVQKTEGAEMAQTVQGLVAELPGLQERGRVPLIDMAFPALRKMSAEQYASMQGLMRRLIAADKKLSFFEYVLTTLVVRRLEVHFKGPDTKPAQIYSVRGVEAECSMVLSVVARLGHRDQQQAEQAFASGVKVLQRPGAGFTLLGAKDCSFGALDKAIDKLNATSPAVKRTVLAACLQCMDYDGRIEVREVEMFRVLAEALGCPMPPWLEVTGSA